METIRTDRFSPGQAMAEGIWELGQARAQKPCAPQDEKLAILAFWGLENLKT